MCICTHLHLKRGFGIHTLTLVFHTPNNDESMCYYCYGEAKLSFCVIVNSELPFIAKFEI